MNSFWKKEIKLTYRFLIVAILAVFVLSGFASGLFLNYVFPQLAKLPLFGIFAPRFPVTVNKTEEIRIDSGVNLSQLYQNLRAVTVSVLSAEGSFNPYERDYHIPSTGTGIVVTSDGLVLTAKRIIGSPQNSVKAVLGDGRIFEASIVAFDSRSELALIKIGAQNLPVAQFGNSADLGVGQKLVAVGPNLDSFGNPGVEMELIKNSRVIADYPEIFDANFVNGFLTVSPVLGEEFLGCGIVNGDSRVIGLFTSDGVLPGEFLSAAIENYLVNGKFSRPAAGFQYAVISPPSSKILNLPKPYGALILSSAGKPAVATGSAASRAGLRDGDFLYKINGRDLSPENTLEKILNEARAGETLELGLYRASQELTIMLTPEELP